MERPTLGVRWRAFQQRALDDLQVALDSGDRRLQLVAPPGSGKTLMGLEMALRTERPILCLSNTQAIQGQWLERLEEFASFPLGGPQVSTITSCELPNDAAPAVLTSVTYQAFCRQLPTAERPDGASPRERLEEPVRAAWDHAGDAGVTLVLDECHHLRRWWAEAIVAYLERFPATVVIGLTATPPADATAEERRRFTRIVTDVTHEIPLVAAVREGLLAPFRDLVRFVRLTGSEERFIAGRESALSACVESLRPGSAEGEAWVEGLDHHILARCIHPGRLEKTWPSFLDMADEEPDFAIALARWVHRSGQALPAEVFPLAEMWFAPTRSDVLALLEDYAIAVLRDGDAAEARARWRRLKTALEGVGVRLQRNGIRDATSEVDEAVGRSRAKLGAALSILTHEWSELGLELCAAVITDFERTAVGGRRVAARAHGEVAGAVGAFRAIVADAALAHLQPVLATGSMRWLPGALLEPLQAKLGESAERLTVSPVPPEEVGGATGFVSVSLPGGGGRLLHALTQLLERDHSHCIVGTRGLLGEGWDCQTLNTLVDLTATRAHVAVNQLRGRALRLDPERPEKVAHIWDIVALPNALVDPGTAAVDCNRFVAKHRRFFAPAADGRLECGPGHVHDALREPEPAWHESERIGRELWSLVSDRGSVRDRWRIGEAVSGTVIDTVALTAPVATRGGAETDSPDSSQRQVNHVALTAARPEMYRRRLGTLQRSAGAVWPGVITGVAGVAVMMAGSPFSGLAGGLLLATGVTVTAWHAHARWRWRHANGAIDRHEQARRVVDVVTTVITQSASRFRAVTVTPHLEGDEVVVHLSGGTAASRARIRAAFDQTLCGCAAPHYALEVLDLAAPERLPSQLLWRRSSGAPERVVGHVPIPTALGTSRKLARVWRNAWCQHLAVGELIAVRRDAATGEIPWRDPAALKWQALRDAPVATRALLE